MAFATPRVPDVRSNAALKCHRRLLQSLTNRARCDCHRWGSGRTAIAKSCATALRLQAALDGFAVERRC